MHTQDRLWQAIMDDLSDGVIVVDAQGKCLLSNPAAAQILGIGPTDARPDVWAERYGLYLPDKTTPYPAKDLPLARVMQGETLDNVEVFVRHAKVPDGLWVSVSARPLRDEAGAPQGGIVFLRDITRHKHAEEARDRLLREQAARSAEVERRSAFLAEASTLFASSIDDSTLLENLARLAVPYFANWCAVDLVDKDQAIRRLTVVHDDPAKQEWARRLQRLYPPDPDAAHGVSQVLRSGQAEFIPEVSESWILTYASNSDHGRVLAELGVQSYMCLPLVTRKRVIGAVTFVRTTADHRYAPADLAFAEELARRAALAVESAQLFQEAQEANRIKDEFLGTVSHELRAPLTSILGWAQMLLSSGFEETAITHGLTIIERNAKAQVQIINDLLDISNIVTGKLRLDFRTVELTPIVETAVNAVRSAADAKQIRLRVVLDPKSGPVLGDPNRLQQVIWNLLSNAIKFTPHGGRIQVRLERVGSNMEITVSDTGAGISAEFLPCIFDRFHQAYSTSTRVPGGLGLGLAIVRHLVELHDGTVHVESRGEGQGASFTVRLRLQEQVHPTVGGHSARAANAHDHALDGVHVLVVDDEPDACELFTVALSRSGAAVKVCGSAAEALKAIEHCRPDVLVSDIGMPGEDGYDLIRRVRALDAQSGGRIPAVALTAFAQGEDRQRALSAGFQVHVPKPVEPAELVAVIANLARSPEKHLNARLESGSS